MENLPSTNNPNILYISDYPLYGNDAPSLHIINICKSFKQLKCRISLIVPNIVKYSNVDFQIYYLPTLKSIVTIFYQPTLFFVSMYFYLFHRPDYVYFRQGPFLVLPILFARILNLKTIIEVNGNLAEEAKLEENLIFKIFVKLHLFSFIEKINYKFINKIIVVTEGLKKHIVMKYSISPHKVVVIQNGVDQELFKPDGIIKKDKKIYIGYVGGIIRWQGLDYLIKSFSKVKVNVPNAQLLIIGDGNYKQNLKVLSKKLNLDNFVKFKDRIPNIEVPKYINSFDICISYPTRYRSGITSPFKIYEYLSCAKPVIISNISELSDNFKETCLIAQSENSEDLASKIIYLAKNESIRNKLSYKARKYILDGHTWNQVAKKILKVMKSI